MSVYDNVYIEDDVFCGPSCVFTNVINSRAFIERKNEYRDTIVKRGLLLEQMRLLSVESPLEGTAL